MPNQQAREFEQQGIQAARAGQKEQARKLLQQSLRLDPDNDTAWVWLGGVSATKKEQLLCLKKALELNPENKMAIKAVQAMGIDPAQLLPKPKTPPPPPKPANPFVTDAVNNVFDDAEDFANSDDIDFGYDEADDFDDYDHDHDYDDQDDFDLDARLMQDMAPPPPPRSTSPPAQPTSFEANQPEDAENFIMPDLDIPLDPPTQPKPHPRPPAVVMRERAIDTEGVPLPQMPQVQSAQREAEAIIRAYQLQTEEDRFSWTQKKRGRVGEREITVLRLQILGALFGILAIGGIIGLVALANSPTVRVIFQGTDVPTSTQTPTATNTPTNTPGLTATPSPTRNFTEEPTFTPSPTIFPSITPGRIEITPVPTGLILPEPPVQAIVQADQFINEGNAEEAIPLMMTQRAGLGQTFDPNPFYYEALAYLETGNTSAALDLLTTAQERIDNNIGVREDDAPGFTALINVGFARTYLRQAEEAFEQGDNDTAQALLEQARTLAEDSQTTSPNSNVAYILLAEANEIEGNYVDTITLVNQAQVNSNFVTDLNLIVAKGEAYLDEGRRLQAAGDPEGARANFENARYEAFYATTLNPHSEAAHQLQVEAALALEDPGLAVIFSQAYLLFFPDSARAFKSLGDARVREGNTDLALAAYNQALEQESADAITAQVLVSRAALHTQQRRFDLAQQDLTEALTLQDTFSTRALRMRAAYTTGDFETARADADSLVGTGTLPEDEIRLLQAQMRVDEARPSDTDRFNEALITLTTLETDLPDSLRPTQDEYLARVHLALGNLADALNAITRALDVEETGSRHYLRGQIYQAQDDRPNAIAEYEWVLTWSRVYAYPFAFDAAARIQQIRERTAQEQAQATATVMTATAAVEQITMTAGAPLTATAEIQATATATAALAITATANAQATTTATAGQARTATADAQATLTEESAIMQTETREAIELRTAEAANLTATIDAERTGIAETATFEIMVETAIMATSTAIEEDRRETMTASAQPTLTPTPNGG